MSKSPSEILNSVSESEIKRIRKEITNKEIADEIKNQLSKLPEEQLENEVKKAGSEENFLKELTKIAIRIIVANKLKLKLGGTIAIAGAGVIMPASAAANAPLSPGGGIDPPTEGEGLLEAVAEFLLELI
uniref:Uncharacterized protein n=1 Tax=Candidatus Kentrum sp. LFY TaxID=2126342 RepID=A0A450U7N9_9GAMM|nr:MAG: hypothetical protein BECKLFY1418B_GA0070995_100818 [Candidatus Kentron sp. LFY]